MPRPRKIALLAVLVVGGGLVVAGPLSHAIHEWRAERAWPQDRERVVDAAAAVALGDGYAPVPCDELFSVDGARCWTTDRRPEDALPDLVGALTSVGATVTPTWCHPTSPDGPGACDVVATFAGTYAYQGINAGAARDIDLEAEDIEGLWLSTTTVFVVPVFTPPS
ncbi:hypothetical protein J4G33_14035 [Actinotalea sp. BY-33]|uniref:Uncharacterized protein n=1 Tax=Actinotalea soli TaxID=2819234 RepID=A0A939LS95_9CELL|nr:hypothetical protein [Actinotalea soli]MBO1752928.1 hypothetical protein [Actinotalea soli]